MKPEPLRPMAAHAFETAGTESAAPVSQYPFRMHLSPADAAAFLGVSEQTLAVWRCTKRYPLPYVKVGRLVRYKTSDLQAFLELRTITVK